VWIETYKKNRILRILHWIAIFSPQCLQFCEILGIAIVDIKQIYNQIDVSIYNKLSGI
jgi:Na+-translocating ferredoxin:NAD+ oxidoreductase RnfA subunit